MIVIPVVYWSGAGSTKRMAEAVVEEINASGAFAKLLRVNETSAAEIAPFQRIALGCPAMGAEELEELEFEPFMSALEPFLDSKRLVLFGSYGWGGSYMEQWAARVENAGARLMAKPVLVLNEPDEAALAACRELAKALLEK